MRAALVALLVLASLGCQKDAPQGSTSSSASPAPSASVAPASSSSAEPAGDAAAPHSQWSKPTFTQPNELVVAPNRAAVLMFESSKGGYFVQRGDQEKRLPRIWFGVGPPRRDLSMTADGSRIAVPVIEPSPGEAAAVIVYETDVARFVGRFALPSKDVPDAGTVEGRVSSDGKYVVWSFPRRACMTTEIATNTLDVDASKSRKCGGAPVK